MLKPKKAKDFIPVVANELNLQQFIVEDIINYYWSEVRKNLSGLKHQRVHISNLGDFIIKYWKIDEKINMLEKWEDNNKQKGLQQMTARFKTVENLFELKELKKIVGEENQRKDFIKLHKKVANEPQRKLNKSLEIKRTNNRRNNK